ncbi:phytoene/squalene synthase family protein [Nocardia rhamnosiphila]|uniref:phytoene/squalene synthase family protein n=1 Tax=Nocardia rhamnosiphila TaxID=426716 RepID=UPI000689736D|nr:phytoene/squalene synthase family protein [Nocardia rhamnosiphila]
MTRKELDAAHIHDPALRRSYRACRDINARHGKTFFLATRLLAPDQRPAIHALYGFARRADDILDTPGPDLGIEERAARLETLVRRFRHHDVVADPTLAAVAHTADTYQLSPELFEAFFESMRMDLSITDYPDRAALDRYVHGSAEVIGLQVLPVLGTIAPRDEAAPFAAALGYAFQLTNFLRDIDEDLARGRIYLPADELAAYGVDRELLHWCRDHRRTDPRLRRALAHQHALTRARYRYAHRGIALLDPRSRPCVATALTLYSEILDRVEDSDFAVFGRRARVPLPRRITVGTTGLVTAWRTRHATTRPHHRGSAPQAAADLIGPR